MVALRDAPSMRIESLTLMRANKRTGDNMFCDIWLLVVVAALPSKLGSQPVAAELLTARGGSRRWVSPGPQELPVQGKK
ncbi:hypothetical protein UY3_03813 [Chelonia mydas]|uniref:Uncharacterized protein n=1 Tax=Chelonia mydas TaxID=8469 RepID=M7BT86_CHEMY|nr:hypothetical protein UY3_03813 [Chelonia mydas]